MGADNAIRLEGDLQPASQRRLNARQDRCAFMVEAIAHAVEAIRSATVHAAVERLAVLPGVRPSRSPAQGKGAYVPSRPARGLRLHRPSAAPAGRLTRSVPCRTVPRRPLPQLKT